MKRKAFSLRISLLLAAMMVALITDGVAYAQQDLLIQSDLNSAPLIILNEPQQLVQGIQGETLLISWQDEDVDDNALISIAYDVDDDPLNEEGHQWIVSDIEEDPDESHDTYLWDTTLVPEGVYFIWAVISDGVNEKAYSTAPGQVDLRIEQQPTDTPEPIFTETPTLDPEEKTLEPTPSQTPEPETGVPFRWQLEMLDSSSQKSFDTILSEQFSAKQIEVHSQAGDVLVEGSRDFEEVREVLFKDLHGVVNLIGGVAEIELEIPVDEPSPVELLLESNLSTGYRWVVVSAMNEGIEMNYSESYIAREGIGAPYIQVITLDPTNIGSASITMRYTRSFEPGAEVTRRLSIQFDAQRSTIDLSDPNQALDGVSDYPESYTVTGSDSAGDLLGLDMGDELPASFDWRALGGVTPIRNQRTCGSCWAFATVGAMESAIAIRTGQYLDLSEQFLVSCNYEGWNCDTGGGTAHPYHYDTLAKNQTDVGAVLEVEKPYLNATGTCTAAYNHPYTLSDWAFISSGTVENIKSAIYTYGPVKVSVCIGPAFQGYTGGIFSTDESGYCPYGTNHAVNLVGWDDAAGVWILRNSWGTYWGESGYMEIRYGTSNIGRLASWVSYPGGTTVVVPTPLTPDTTIADTTPTYTWTRINGATRYQYQLYKGDTLIYANTVPASVCSASGCSSTASTELSTGEYKWRVCAYVDGVWYAASAFKQFTISFTPTPLSPSGVFADNTPTYTWSKIDGVTKYQYQLYRGSTLVYASTVTSSVCGVTTCSATPTAVLGDGEYRWRVSANVDGVWRSASALLTFNISLIPSPISPSGAITDTTPGYTWSKLENAARYQYQLYKDGIRIYAYTVDAAGVCGATECSSTPSETLSPGNYQWRVCAYVEGIWRSTSPFMSFSIASTEPTPTTIPVLPTPVAPGVVVPTPVTPNGMIADLTPSYTWTKINGATRYQIQLYKAGTLVYANTISSSVCGSSQCVTTPLTPLSYGEYQWRVCASVDGVWRSASAFMNFTISFIPQPIAPANTISDTTPTFTWSKLEGVTRYQFQLYQGASRIYAYTVTSGVCGTTQCSSTPTVQLSAGDYRWRVCAYVDGIWRSSSAFLDFTLN